MWKITILRQKNLIFSNIRGGARRVRPPPPPESAPGIYLNTKVDIPVKYRDLYKMDDENSINHKGQSSQSLSWQGYYLETYLSTYFIYCQTCP